MAQAVKFHKVSSCNCCSTVQYQTVVNEGTQWRIPTYYTDLHVLGIGSFGQVCSVLDRRSNERVAIKKIIRPFQTAIHAKRVHREIRLLSRCHHENIIKLIDVFTPDSSLANFNDVYLVTELMASDLDRVMRVQHLSNDHIKFLTYQILRALKYLHSVGIIHRDLKPNNIAVNADCEVKLLDFGLARQVDYIVTGYVTQRWYRAPEIILDWQHYTNTVDVWAVACILAEMLLGKVLFQGSNHIDQLRVIMEVTGTPSQQLLGRLTSYHAVLFVLQLGEMPRKDFHVVFPVDSVTVDLLERMLELDPVQRISAVDALAHPYFGAWRDPADEPVAEPFSDDMESFELDASHWKEQVYHLLQTFRE